MFGLNLKHLTIMNNFHSLEVVGRGKTRLFGGERVKTQRNLSSIYIKP